ncbi:MAG: hypothetical protein ACJ736_23045 [Streptomyces sp.]
MATPPVRTFISGPVLTLLAPRLAALAPGPAADDRTGPPPGFFGWFSTRPLIGPAPDAGHPIVSVKDPTVLRYGFADWSQAADAHPTFLDADPDTGNRCPAAPQVRCFAPRNAGTWPTPDCRGRQPC